MAEKSESRHLDEIAVVGAGTMGHAIAATFAMGGATVRLFDVDHDALRHAQERIGSALETLVAHDAHELTTSGAESARDRISYTTALDSAVDGVAIVFEAVPERLELKQDVFADIESAADDETILATNTSSLSVTAIGEPVELDARFVGTHWFSPPHIVPVVEVVRAEGTSDETMETTADLLTAAGKTPVIVQKELPGFIGNRIQSAMANEAWALLQAGVASAEDIDRAVKGTFGFRLPILGVFEKGDHSGLDVHHKVLTELLPDIDRSTTPPDVLTDLVDDGRHGIKTGMGVYDWQNDDREAVERRRDQYLLEQLDLYRDALAESKTDGSDR